MAKEALQTNSFTKEARPGTGTEGVFGSGRFGSARFGQTDVQYPKEALASNSFTKETLTSQIS